MKTAIIYTRVSTDEQAEKGFSLRDQKSKLEKYCGDNSIEIVRHFEDDHSAKTFDRPQFNLLLEYVKQHKGFVKKLLVVKFDRFTRNMMLGLNMISQLKQYGVAVEAIEQPLDYDVPENLLMQAIYLAAPQVENQRRSLNTTNGMRKAMKEGRFVTTAPIGYKNMRDEKGRAIIVKSDKAGLVHEAFDLYSTGIYEKEEVRKMLVKKGMHLLKNAFNEMLRNPVYCGKIKVPAYKDEPEEIVQGAHEAIITEELFDKVQRVLNVKRRITSKYKKLTDDLPLRGFLVCRLCGEVLTGSVSKGNGGIYIYYHCQRGCKERFRADDAHDYFTKWLEMISMKSEYLELNLAVMKDIFNSEEGNKELEIAQLKKQKAEKQETLRKAGLKLVEDILDKSTYQSIKKKLEQEINEIDNRLSELKESEDDCMEYVQFGFKLLSQLSKCYNNSELLVKRKIIGSIFPEKLIFEEKKYRTTQPSAVLSLLFNAGKGFKGAKKKRTAKKTSQSSQVSLARLELATQ